MRLLFLVLPSVAAAAAGLLGGRIHRRARPQFAAPTLAALAVTASMAVIVSLGLVAFGWAGWCRAVYSHDQVPAWLGVPALVSWPLLLGAMAHASRRWRASVHSRANAGNELDVLDTDEPIAYAVPGSPGYIVVSVGMLTRLKADERIVLLAHERSHLVRHHHRYLWMVEIASAAVPVLRPMRSQVRFATERWADEDAAREVGDRRLVARAISRAALAQADHAAQPAMALVGSDVAARVDALLAGRNKWLAQLALTATALTTAVAVGGSVIQVDRVWMFLRHICVTG